MWIRVGRLGLMNFGMCSSLFETSLSLLFPLNHNSQLTPPSLLAVSGAS